MHAEHWARIKEILDTVLDLPAEQRTAVVAQCCGSDDGLRREVEAFLAAEAEIETFMERPAFSLRAKASGTDRVGERLGPYTLGGLSGRGGMSEVYRAERNDGLYEQQVAVKILNHRLGARTMLERQILADLEHPNVARIIDGGATEDGFPYFVMEYVDGLPIDRYCHEERLGIDSILALFQQVCQAVHFAHQRLIVHCDLKPGNILITRDGVPKLLDFGIAKPLRDAARETAAKTSLSHLGTPGYASPEQKRNAPLSTASDVYSLGVLLHRLLACVQPGAPGETEAPLYASRTAERGIGREPRLDRPWCRRLRGDLDWIVQRATCPQPEDRYGSALELVRDLQLFLEHRPITARPESWLYRTRRFVQRNPLAVASIAAVLGMLSISFVVVFEQLRLSEESREWNESVANILLDSLEGELSLDDILNRLPRSIFQSDLGKRALWLDRLGRVLLRANQLDESERLVREALRLRETLGRHGSLAVAHSLSTLGLVKIKQGSPGEGVRYFQEAQGVPELNKDEKNYAKLLNNWATALEAQGVFKKAEDFYREALNLKVIHFGEPSEEVAIGLNNLLKVLITQEKLIEAEALSERNLRMRREWWGEDHPRVAVALMNHAALLDGQGRSDEAVKTYREAVRVRQNADLLDPAALALARGALAYSLSGRNKATDLVEAEELVSLAWADYRRDRKRPSASRFALQRHYAAILLARGKIREATFELEEILDKAPPYWEGPLAWRLADVESLLGECYLQLGRLEEAEPLIRRSAERIQDGQRVPRRYNEDARSRVELLDETMKTLSSARGRMILEGSE